MNVSRGNFGAFVLGEKLYAIGGSKENEEALAIVCSKQIKSTFVLNAKLSLEFGILCYFSGYQVDCYIFLPTSCRNFWQVECYKEGGCWEVVGRLLIFKQLRKEAISPLLYCQLCIVSFTRIASHMPALVLVILGWVVMGHY